MQPTSASNNALASMMVKVAARDVQHDEKIVTYAIAARRVWVLVDAQNHLTQIAVHLLGLSLSNTETPSLLLRVPCRSVGGPYFNIGAYAASRLLDARQGFTVPHAKRK